MNCRTPTVVQLKLILGFNEHDIVVTKEESVLTKIMKIFSSEKILLQPSVFKAYKVDLYFPRHNLAIEGDEKEYKYSKKNERGNNIKEYIGCKLIRFNPD